MLITSNNCNNNMPAGTCGFIKCVNIFFRNKKRKSSAFVMRGWRIICSDFALPKNVCFIFIISSRFPHFECICQFVCWWSWQELQLVSISISSLICYCVIMKEVTVSCTIARTNNLTAIHSLLCLYLLTLQYRTEIYQSGMPKMWFFSNTANAAENDTFLMI